MNEVAWFVVGFACGSALQAIVIAVGIALFWTKRRNTDD